MFVTSSCDGQSGTLVDIIAFRLGHLTNITLDPESGRSVESVTGQSILINDIGGRH